jgi:outer membrane lipoprotein-sorting protein
MEMDLYGLESKKCNMKKKIIVILVLVVTQIAVSAQNSNALLQKVKAKLDRVNDYVAEGKMKTDVAFIKAPAGKIKVYYKQPDRFKVKRDKGISILPKGGVSFNMRSLLSTSNFTSIETGESTVGGTKVKVIKLLPTDENSDVILTTLYIDEALSLIRKTNTTTRENGTFEMEMNYGKYAEFGLPDKVIFSFNTKNYKIPKGITMEFDTDEPAGQNLKNKKGRVEITYSSYVINKGLGDNEFK